MRKREGALAYFQSIIGFICILFVNNLYCVTSKPVMYIPFDEGQGKVCKEIFQQSDVSIHNCLWTEGKINKCLYFNGKDSYLSTPVRKDTVSSTGTIELWVRPEGKDGTIIAYAPSGIHYINNHLEIKYQSKEERIWVESRWNCETWPYQWVYTSPDGSVPLETWTLIHLVQDGICPKIYINGELVVEIKQGRNITSWTDAGGDNPWWGWLIGGCGRDPDDRFASYFRGCIDEVRVYNYPLSKEQIKKHYEGVYEEKEEISIQQQEGLPPAKPSFIKEGERQSAEISGEWEFLSVSSLSYPPPEGKWEKRTVGDYRSSHSGQKKVWYRKRVIIPSSVIDKDRRLLLWFERIFFASYVYFNGQKVGENRDGFLPFECDITDLVKPDDVNEILVGVEGVEGAYKDGVMFYPIGPAPLVPYTFGILGQVKIISRPDVYISDVFVKTSFREKKISVDITINNLTEKDISLSLVNDIYDKEDVVKKLLPQNILIKKGEEKTVSVECEWQDPVLWTPDNPHLYVLKTSLKNNKEEIDSISTRFGFREVWLEGQNIYLNGMKIRLKATWGHIGEYMYVHGPRPSLSAKEVLQVLKEHNINTCRFHGVVFPSEFFDAADEIGMLVINESAIYHTPRTDGSIEHTKRWVKRDRNHPSVIIWSGTNEFVHWAVPRVKENTKFLIEQQKLILSLDPTRIVIQSSYGSMDGEEMVYALHYPVASNIHPNSFYWPVDENIPMNPIYKDMRWDKNKPFFISEECFLFGIYQIVGGDKLYQKRALDMFNEDVIDAVGKTFKMAMEVYRFLNINLICDNIFAPSSKRYLPNPYLEKVSEIFAPVGVYVKEYDHLFYERTEVKRTVISYNETLQPQIFTLVWEFTNDDRILKQGKETFTVPPGEINIKEIILNMPAVSKRTEVTLKLSLQDSTQKVLASSSYNYSVFPQVPLRLNHTESIGLFDPEGTTAEIFAKENLRVKLLKPEDINNIEKLGLSLLIIGSDGFSYIEEVNPSVIAEFVRNGGRVLVLEQKVIPPVFPSKVDAISKDKDFGATICFPRAVAHPILKELEEDDLKFWDIDNFVAKVNIKKPAQGNYIPIVDNPIMNISPVIEIPYGRGCYVISQLLITEKFNKVPVAKLLFQNMLEYLLSYKSEMNKKVGLLDDRQPSSFNSSIKLDLNILCESLDNLNNIDLFGILIIDAKKINNLKSSEIENLKQFAKKGGVVLLHNVEPEIQNTVGLLVDKNITLTKVEDIPGVVIKPTSLTKGIGSYDLFWDKRIISYSISVEPDEGVEILSEPPGLIKICYGDGYFLINQFRFDLNISDDRAVRFFSILLTNIGVPAKPIPIPKKIESIKKNYNYVSLDIKEYCNEGFDDKKYESVRYIQNYLEMEKVNVTSKIMEEFWGEWLSVHIPLSKFVGRNVFNGIPFYIIDPQQNNGKSCIILTNITEVSGHIYKSNKFNLEKVIIPVNKRMDELYFLHTMIRNYYPVSDEPIVGKYIIHYPDGTSETVLLKRDGESTWWFNHIPEGMELAIETDHPHPRAEGFKVRFFITKWKNPRSEEVITDIEFVRGDNYAYSPVLVAITGREK